VVVNGKVFVKSFLLHQASRLHVSFWTRSPSQYYLRLPSQYPLKVTHLNVILVKVGLNLEFVWNTIVKTLNELFFVALETCKSPYWGFSGNIKIRVAGPTIWDDWYHILYMYQLGTTNINHTTKVLSFKKWTLKCVESK
jgi:hypothetical protein